MRTLLIFFYGLIVLQCNNDIELIETEADKNSIENLVLENYVPSKIPLNWPWRGINITSSGSQFNEQALNELKTKGVDAVRLEIFVKRFCINNNLSIEVGMEPHLKWVEKVIQWCAKEDIVVILHSKDFPLDPLKKFNHTTSEFWDSEDELSAALSYINQLVLKFDKYENVVAYDFFSEPVVLSIDGAKRPEIWFDFFNRILNTIRMHSNKYVVFTPGVWGLAGGYRDFTEPIKDDKIIYGFHYYNPHSYTHQGIKEREQSYSYPGLIEQKYWDKNTIREGISLVSNWAKNNNKLVYVGEFSVVRWAEGKEQYLEDVLNILEENQMGYSYWCFNSWIGWNMDYEEKYEGSKKLAESPQKTKTRLILENFWTLNGQ